MRVIAFFFIEGAQKIRPGCAVLFVLCLQFSPHAVQGPAYMIFLNKTPREHAVQAQQREA